MNAKSVAVWETQNVNWMNEYRPTETIIMKI